MSESGEALKTSEAQKHDPTRNIAKIGKAWKEANKISRDRKLKHPHGYKNREQRPLSLRPKTSEVAKALAAIHTSDTIAKVGI